MTTQKLVKEASEGLFSGQPVSQQLVKEAAEGLIISHPVSQQLVKNAAEVLFPPYAVSQAIIKAAAEAFWILPRVIDLAGLGWSVKITPVFDTLVASHVSGRESRMVRSSTPVLDIELTFDFLRMDVAAEYQKLAGFYEQAKASALPFVLYIPIELGFGDRINCRFAEDQLDLDEFMSRLWRCETVKLRQILGE